ncbi:MAG: DUF1330 domain-containing protein [Alphaproteobacteria bacterium]
MTKPAYMIIGIDIHNEGAMGPYAVGTMPILERYNAQVLAGTSNIEHVDGNWARKRVVLIKFPSMKHANAFWNAPEYTSLKLLREDSSEQDNMLVEGMMDEDPNAPADEGTPYYMLGLNDMKSADWVPEYQEKVPPIAAKFGVQGLAAGDQFQMLDGDCPRGSMVLLKFPSEQKFKDFWFGKEYAAMKKLREDNTESDHIGFPGVVE